jgi:hypothetical protein
LEPGLQWLISAAWTNARAGFDIMSRPSPLSSEDPWPRTLVVGRPPLAGSRAPAFAWPLSHARAVVVVLVCLVVVAGVFRCRGLDYGGFSADEVNKIQAVRAYSRGDWSANAEHPMVMKMAMWASLSTAGAWNGVAERHGWATIPPEAALRLPNALIGAAAVIPLYLLVQSFFGSSTALWAALLLALDLSASGINRIGKEDSFLVFFLLLGAWLYEEARARHLRDGRAPHLWYAASGAAFGVMLASKYLLHYLGLWALFTVAAGAESDRVSAATGRAADTWQRASWHFYAAIPAAFVVANPAILLPDTWRYILAYVMGTTITHHGAYFAGHIYSNMPGDTVWGLPWHFYLTYILTKTPLPVLAAAAVGVAELVRRCRERGAVFARVFLVFFLLPASLAASKSARYLLPTLVILDVVAALGIVRAAAVISRLSHPRLSALATAMAVTLVIGTPLLAQVCWSPVPSLYQNPIGRLVSSPGGMFPNEELYDAGVRESVAWIVRRAAPGASIASDAPSVVREYLRRDGRDDIEARSLSMAGVARPPVEAWVLAQNSHACFESAQVIDQLRRRPPAFVYRVCGTTAVETYRMPW